MEVKRTCSGLRKMSAYDPKRTLELPPNRYTLRMAITKER